MNFGLYAIRAEVVRWPQSTVAPGSDHSQTALGQRALRFGGRADGDRSNRAVIVNDGKNINPDIVVGIGQHAEDQTDAVRPAEIHDSRERRHALEVHGGYFAKIRQFPESGPSS